MNTIVLIDRGHTQREQLAALQQEGYTLLAASSVEEGISLLGRNPSVKAVLLDEDCLEVLHKMQENMLWQKIPVFAMVHGGDSAVQKKALSLGAGACVEKPCDLSVLKPLLDNAIRLCEHCTAFAAHQQDNLTGLLNREAFFLEAENMIKAQKPGYYVMACFDIDSFKVINDRYGTEKGDSVLRHAARCLSACISPMGGICCRFMADMFGVLYPAQYKNSENLLALHKMITQDDGINRAIRVRIGRYPVTDISLSVSSMFDRAILATESIKGRYDLYIAEYSETMRDNLLHEQEIVNEMDRALAAGEFEPWFQPQYNHVTGTMIGSEALARWRRGGRLVPPCEFIPIFERNGFVYELDQFIWRRVCILLRRWLDEGREPLPISVNISRHDVFQKDFFTIITGLVKEFNIPLELLRLEVTESAFAESTKTIIHIVNDLIRFGFTVEIDDFGSGYSSLNTLKDVPASILKLDMKFMENTSESKRGGNILESVVRMARWLGMAVIAEGVETVEQADFLKSIGCDYVQGYLYGRPMPLAGYEKLCEAAEKEPELTRLKTVDTWNNSAFWDPNSMETLIFNSYVGGACIFEYCNGKTELLRFNERYQQLFPEDFISGKVSMGHDPFSRMNEENRSILFDNIENAIRTKKESTCEVCLARQQGGSQYLRTTVRLIARTVDRCLFYCVVADITAQRVAEKKEMESAHLLQVIMGNINGGVSAIRINDDGTSQFVFNNERYFSIFGYTREQAEAEHLDVMTLICPEDLPYVMAKVKKLKQDRKPTIIDYRCRRRDGRLIYLRVNASMMDMEGYADDVITAVLTDITEKKENEDQLRAIVDNIYGGVSATVMRGGTPEFIVVNDRFFQLLGYTTRQEYEAECDDKYARIHPEDRERIKNQFESSDGGKTQYTMEYRIIRKDGAIRYIRNNISVISIFGVDGPVQLSVANDVTDLLVAQLKEHNLSTQLQAIMENIHGGLSATVYRGRDDLQIVFANDGFYAMYGYTREQFEAEVPNVLDAIYPQDREKTMALVEKLVRERGSATYEYRCVKRNGGIVWTRCSNSVISLSGVGDTVLLAVFSDVTAERDTEEEQKQLLDNLPCGAALYEYNGKDLSVIHINKRYWELVEREPVDYSRTSVFGAIHPEDVQTLHQELEAAIRQKRNVECDARILTGDGSYRPFHIVANVVPRQNGICSCYTFYMPISDQTMSIQEMLPIALATMMSSSDDLSFVKDRDLRYICCSHSVAEMLGFASERELIGKSSYDLFSREVADAFAEQDHELMKTGRALVNHIEMIPRENGVVHYVKISRYPLLDAAGNVIGLYGISQDITRTRENEFQLKLLTESIPGGLVSFYFSPQGMHRLYFNEGFYNFSGYTREEYLRITENDPLTLVLEEDKAKLREMAEQLNADKGHSEIRECIYRCRTKDGNIRWFSLKGRITDSTQKGFVLNAVQYDITEEREAQEKLRVSEEENRLAIAHSGNIVTKFDVPTRTLTLPAGLNPIFQLPPLLCNMPAEQIALGRVSPETAGAYTALFESIAHGSASGTATFQQNSAKGWRWLKAQYTTVFSAGQPVSAVITFVDITEQLEKEVVYNKWQQSLNEREDDSYTLFRCNLSKDTAYDSREGTLLKISFSRENTSFDENTAEYAEKCVYEEDREKYLAFLNSDAMLASYYRGYHSHTLEYRQKESNGNIRWLRLSADLVEYPNSRDIEAYLMYENIDTKKKEELLVLERAQTDALTGVLNRATFIARLEQILENAKPGDKHALLMLDVDEFKQINDTLGHSAGDEVLRELTESIGSILRHDDMIGRLGGDEFLVFLRNIPNDAAAAAKAEQICNLRLRVPKGESTVTASIGIAVVPRDGKDFETLYKMADTALYQVKRSGKAGYQFCVPSASR